MTGSLLDTMAAWTVARRWDSFTPDARKSAERGVLDTWSAILAGRAHRVPQLARQATTGWPGSSVELVGCARIDAASAAFVNGVAAHVLDYDDSAVGNRIGHPSAVVLPTVWAVASEVGATGDDLLTGYMTGVECMMRLASAFGGGGGAYGRGFHSTTILGTVGAAAGAARVAGLDLATTRAAIGLAGSWASGMQATFGSPGKALQVGRAAEAAVRAVELARAGLDAGTDVLDSQLGYPRVFFGASDDDAAARADRFLSLGGSSAIGDGEASNVLADPGLRLKPYASCRGSHRSIEAAIELRRSLDLEPDEIVRVEIDPTPEARQILRYSSPETELEAKFSVEYGVAVSLVDGAGGIAQFRQDRIMSPDVRRVLDKVEVTPTDDEATFTEAYRPESVSVTTARGTFRKVVELELGHPRRPLSAEHASEKFVECVQEGVPGIERSTAEEVRDVIEGLSDGGSLADLDARLISLVAAGDEA